MFDYNNFESIKTIEDFNEIIDDDDKRTYFHHICTINYNKLEVIKYCVKHGADLNIKDKYGNIPFYFMCCNTTIKEVLEYCLENGADLTIENYFQYTPFDFICGFNKDLIPICKPYMNEYDYIKTLKEFNLNWKEYD